MAREQEFYFPSSDGAHRCYAHLWLPAGEPRGVVQIVHGVAEHIMRYEHFAAWLAGHGFAVAGEDHLGHGRTAEDEKFGFFAPKNGWELVVKDVRQLRVQLGERFPDAPFFMLGHSMGSFLTRTYLINWPGTVDGAVLSGTGQEAPLTLAAGRLAARLVCALRGADSFSQWIYDLSLGGYNKQFEPGRTRLDWLTRDEAVVDSYDHDPFCAFQPTAGMFCDMLGGLQYIAKEKNLKRMYKTTPVYFFSGDRDPVGGNGAGVERVAELFRQAGCTDVTVKLYPGGRHEMLNEINRQEVYQDTLAWMEAKL